MSSESKSDKKMSKRATEYLGLGLTAIGLIPLVMVVMALVNGLPEAAEQASSLQRAAASIVGAFGFAASLAIFSAFTAIGVLLFLGEDVADPGRHLLGVLGVAFGVMVLLGALAVDSSWSGSVGARIAGKLPMAAGVAAGAVLAVGFAWWTWFPQAIRLPARPAFQKKPVQKTTISDALSEKETDGVSAAESHALVPDAATLDYMEELWRTSRETAVQPDPIPPSPYPEDPRLRGEVPDGAAVLDSSDDVTSQDSSVAGRWDRAAETAADAGLEPAGEDLAAVDDAAADAEPAAGAFADLDLDVELGEPEPYEPPAERVAEAAPQAEPERADIEAALAAEESEAAAITRMLTAPIEEGQIPVEPLAAPSAELAIDELPEGVTPLVMPESLASAYEPIDVYEEHGVQVLEPESVAGGPPTPTWEQESLFEDPAADLEQVPDPSEAQGSEESEDVLLEIDEPAEETAPELDPVALSSEDESDEPTEAADLQVEEEYEEADEDEAAEYDEEGEYEEDEESAEYEEEEEGEEDAEEYEEEDEESAEYEEGEEEEEGEEDAEEYEEGEEYEEDEESAEYEEEEEGEEDAEEYEEGEEYEEDEESAEYEEEEEGEEDAEEEEYEEGEEEDEESAEYEEEDEDSAEEEDEEEEAAEYEEEADEEAESEVEEPMAEEPEPAEAEVAPELGETEPEVVLDPTPAPEGHVPAGLAGQPLLLAAGNLFLEEGRVAVSLLQRRFDLDFEAACDVLDELQEAGLIGPYMGGQQRDILLTPDEWAARVPAS